MSAAGPAKCIFCPHSIMSAKFRARSAINGVDEIEYWYAAGRRQFVVDDDNFTLVRARVYEICDEIERRGLRDLFIRCANGIRADKLDRDPLSRMKEVGVREVGFGADGGNNRVLLDIVHKGETIETIEQAIQDAISVGLQVRLFIIVGHPGETLSDVEDSFALAQRYPLIRLRMKLVANLWALKRYSPAVYPGRFHLFLTKESLAHSPRLGWTELAVGGVEVHEIPGTHRSITGDSARIEEAQMQVLGEKLRACMDNALMDELGP